MLLLVLTVGAAELHMNVGLVVSEETPNEVLSKLTLGLDGLAN